MSDRILLNPDNRWLGSSSSQDFSLYGAQPDPAVSLRPADSTRQSDEAETGAASAPAAADQSPRGDPAREPDAAAQQVSSPAPQAASPATPQSTGEPASSASPSSEAPATGSLIPLASAAAAFPQNPVLPAGIAPADEPPAATPTVAPLVSTTAEPTPAPTATDPAFAPQIAESQLGDVATGAFATLGPVDAAADVADDVQDLLGADPAAGIATLVSLVSITDVLPVTEAANDAGEKAEDPTADLLNALAAEPVTETNLLGEDSEGPSIPGIVTSTDPTGGVDLPGGLG